MPTLGKLIYNDLGFIIGVEKEQCDWGIGNNGFIYYDSNAFENYMDKICYIPEYGDIKNSYSRKDFIRICGGDVDKAKELFDMVDWQSPEILYEELNWEDYK